MNSCVEETSVKVASFQELAWVKLKGHNEFLRAVLTCWTLIKVWLTLIHATWTGTKASGKGTRLLRRELPGRGIPVPVHEEQQQSPTCGP